MLKFNEDLGLDHLPCDVYKDLVNALSIDNSWKKLAQYVCVKLDYSSLWLKDLENKANLRNETPADQLLLELNTKMCTVEILCTLLENCDLPNILSILQLPEPLNIFIHPDQIANYDDLCIALGDQLHLTCKASGLPPPNYQWYHEDNKLEGQIFNELKVSLTYSHQKGTYRCQVYQLNHLGEIIEEIFSKHVIVKIKSTPVIIKKQPQALSEIKEGDNLVLCCEAVGYPSPQFQWYRNNERLDNQTFNILQIENFAPTDKGKYYCHIFNDVSEKYTDHSTVLLQQPRQKAVAKVALLIANENYKNQQILRTPKNDVAKVANILNGLGFYTICLADLTLCQMKNAIKIFCDSLVEETYALFYFAGHGFKMQENYLLSVDAPTNFLRKDAICESYLLSAMLKSDPALLVVVLDMCQTFPPVELNPEIHEEVPLINEYKGPKNLRNLLQAYSTSSYRPSYERMGKNYGLYATHLCKYLDKNIPVTKLFEQVGKSIDTCLKGAERKQIPMFATTITKPYRLTDSIFQNELPPSIEKLKKIMLFPNKIVNINFQQTGIQCKSTISQYSKPYLNFIQVSLIDLDEKWEVNFYNSVPTKNNNLFRCSSKNKCWIHNPQINKGPLVISLLKDGVHVGASLLEINGFIPDLLNKLDV